jgi:hypothetical protein
MPVGRSIGQPTTLLQAIFLSLSKDLIGLGTTEQHPNFPAAQGNSGKKIESGRQITGVIQNYPFYIKRIRVSVRRRRRRSQGNGRETSAR